MRRQFLGEKTVPGTGMAQRSYARLARVVAVEPAKGEITLNWLDAPGMTKATYSQSDCSIYAPPTPGMTCLVALGAGNVPHVLRYLPIGYAARVAQSGIPQVGAGEVFIESLTGAVDGAGVPMRTGTDFYMNNAGDVTFTTAYGDSWQIRRDDNLLMQKFANWELQTEAGRLFVGVVRRAIGGNTRIITSGDVPLAAGGTPLTEFRLSIVEQADTDPAASPGTDDPIVDVVAGSVVDDQGQRLRSSTGDKLVLRARTKQDNAVVEIDDQGHLTIQAKTLQFKTSDGTGLAINTNSDGDVVITVDSGKKLKLGDTGATRNLVQDLFVTTFYNTHMHNDAFGLPTLVPLIKPSATDVCTTKTVAD